MVLVASVWLNSNLRLEARAAERRVVTVVDFSALVLGLPERCTARLVVD